MRFLLREDMPLGFRENTQYPELPAAVKFLAQYQVRTFGGVAEFEAEIAKFPEYLRQQQVPESSDKALRAGLSLEEATGGDGVLNVVTKSDESFAKKCWFGSFGLSLSLDKYFTKQREARQRQIVEEDDTP